MSPVMETASLFKVEVAAYLKLCAGVDSPRSLACSILASNGEWDQLINLANHFDDQNVPHSAGDYLVTSIMKKNPRVPLGISVDQVALDKFLECEAHVKKTNITFTQPQPLAGASNDVRRVILRARKYIARVLGPLSTADLEYVWERARFGPGSTSAVSGIDVSVSRKYGALGATPRLAHVLKRLIPTLWWEAAGTLEQPVIWHSCVTTVPKNAKTARPICVEPHMNIYVQLGIGALIRRKLANDGLDLNHQADHNRFLASQAQAWGLCTIDLESASDTVSSALVRYLLPGRWTHLLELARTDVTKMPDGTYVGLEKWSSMGNGYTFELESLIFWALARASNRCKAHTAVYGDDIIVPAAASTILLGALEYCGFRVNGSKTFLAGPFFESCGTDWLSGIDIRPFYFKAECTSKDDKIDAQIKITNQIRLFAHKWAQMQEKHACDKRLLPAWLCVRSTIPFKWRNCRIPMGYGDDCGLVSNFDEAAPSFNRVFGEHKFSVRRRKPETRRISIWHGHLLSHLRTYRHRVQRFIRCGPEFARYLEDDPLRSISIGKNGKIKIRDLPMELDLRGCMGEAQLAVGRSKNWPSLGPWV